MHGLVRKGRLCKICTGEVVLRLDEDAKTKALFID
jgi:hypothetical protein